MNSSTARSNNDPDLARWGLVALALVIGAFLMVYYVQLLQNAVSRGAQTRYSQAQGPRDMPADAGARASVKLVAANR